MMTAAPWRLDAIEILQIARSARYDGRHIVDVIREVAESGEVEVDKVGDETTAAAPTHPATLATDGDADEGSGGGRAPPPNPAAIGPGPPGPPRPPHAQPSRARGPARTGARRQPTASAPTRVQPQHVRPEPDSPANQPIRLATQRNSPIFVRSFQVAKRKSVASTAIPARKPYSWAFGGSGRPRIASKK